MVAVFTGLGAGLERGSGSALGGAGLLGSSSLGRGGEAVFLNAANGNLVLSRQDEFLIGRGPDLSIARTYNNQGALDDNGDHWHQSTDRRIVGSGAFNTTGHTVVRVSADGSEITYTYDAWSDGSYYRATDGAGAHDKLVYNSGDWTWTDGSSRVSELYKVSDGGFISEQSDVDGNTINFTYTSGKLTKIATANDASGAQSYIEYAWAGDNITSVATYYTDLASSTEGTFTRTTYGYDSQDRLTTVTVDLTPTNTSDSSTYVTTYTYDGTSNRVASITQSDGSSLEIGYTYDASAGLHRVTQLVQTVASGDTRTTSIDYIDETNGFLRTEVTDPRGQVTKIWSKIATGELTRISAPPATTGAAAQIVEFSYDADGNVSSVLDAGAGATAYQHDAFGNVTQITDANNNVTTRTYDANNSLTLETRTGSSAASGSASLHARFVYDAENHLRYAISAAGQVIEYRYTAAGELAEKIEYPRDAYTIGSSAPTEAQMDAWRDGIADRSTTKLQSFAYDLRGNLTSSISYGATDVSGGAVTSEGYKQTFFTYDQTGRLLNRNVAGMASEVFVYDGMGRLTASTDLGGATTTIVFNDAQTTTTVTTQLGYTSVSTYNKAGELISRSDSGPADAFTTTGTATYLYDKNGNVRRMIDATGKKSFYLYDNAGRRIADVGQDGQLIEYKYDANSRVIATVRYANALTAGQVATLDSATPAEVELGDVSFPRPAADNDLAGGADIWSWNVYDAGGRIVKTITGDGSVATYGYDEADRLIATTTFYNKLSAIEIGALIAAPDSAAPIPSADAARDRITRSFYDQDGRLVGALNAEGYLSAITYDGAGQKVHEITYASATSAALRATGTFDDLAASITPDATKDVSKRYVYDGQGLLRFEIDPVGGFTEYVYWDDAAESATGLVRRTTVYFEALGAVSDYEHATIKAKAATLARPADDRVSYFAYNARGQLQYTVDALGGVSGFAYDTEGRVNRSTRYATLMDTTTLGVESAWVANLDAWAASNNTGARITRTYYNVRGQVVYVVDAERYVSAFSYDSAGRVLNETRYADRLATSVTLTDATTIGDISGASKGAPATTTYVYDAIGRMSDATAENGVNDVRRHITYLANGMKATETVAYGSDHDASVTYFEYDQAGKLLRRIDGYGQDGAATTQYAYDGIGNLLVVTDPLGNTTSYTYDKVGRVTVRTDALGGATTYVYDAFGRGVKTTDAGGASTYTYFNRLGSVLIFVDEAGYVTQTAYNAFGEAASTTKRAISTADAAVGAPPAITADTADAIANFAYDKLGRVVSQSNALSHVTSYEYDAFGGVVKNTDARGNPSYYYYDALGRVTLAIDEEKYATQTTYNAQGQINTVTRRYSKVTGAFGVGAAPTVPVHPGGDATTTFYYDLLGQLTQETDALGGVTKYEYDLRGNRTKTTNALGGVTERKFDDFNRMTEETVWFGDYGVAGQAKSTSKFTYDESGNLTQKIEAFDTDEERKTAYAYDELNRLEKITYTTIAAVNFATLPGVAPVDVTPFEEFSYDAKGNLIEKRDALGARTLYWHDTLGRVKYELAASEISGSNQLGTLAFNKYDANGNVIERKVFGTLVTLPVTAGDAAPTEPTAKRLTIYTYDKLNRLKTSTVVDAGRGAYGTQATGGYIVDLTADLTTTYDYDANGNVVRVVDPNGAQTWSYYDKLGHKTAQVDAERYRTDWSYDANGNVMAETRYAAQLATWPTVQTLPNVPSGSDDDNRTTNFTYDKMGRRKDETRVGVKVHNGAGAHAEVDAKVAYTYNALGQVLTKVEATGDAIKYGYDRAGRLTSEERTLDGLSYLYTDFNGAAVAPKVTYEYNALSDLKKTTSVGNANAANRVTTFTYGKGGLLLSKTNAQGFVRTYIYDAAGRVAREQYARITPHATDPDLNTTVYEAVGYAYDLRGRVIDQGLMLKIDGVYTRNATNALGLRLDTAMMHYNAYGEVSERGINGAYSEKFEYDAAGRVIRTNSGDGAWKYFMYDGAGNQTLMIQSVGADLNVAARDTISEVLALWPNTAALSTTNITGVTATITLYSTRNLALRVLEPQRQLAASGSLVNLATQRVYNAFGEVVMEGGADSWNTNYTALDPAKSVEYVYNTMGRVIQITSPAVAVTSEAGVTTNNYRPVEHRYYDASGRLRAQRSANGHITHYNLLAGSGYNGTEALVTSVIAPDGGTTTTKYDIQGDARRIVDQLGQVTTQSFDLMSRLVGLAHGVSVDWYIYDGLGQRIRHTNNLFNNSITNPSFVSSNFTTWLNTERTTYDAQGRIERHVAFGGDVTTYEYGWSSTLATAGMGTFGGWTQKTTAANGKSMTEKTDMFGHAVSKINFGGFDTAFTYDKAGRLTQRSGEVGEAALNLTYFNTGKLATMTSTVQTVFMAFGGTNLYNSDAYTTQYGYDRSGNLIAESLVDNAVRWTFAGSPVPVPTSMSYTYTYKNATTTFDLLGRIVSWTEAGSAQTPAASHTFQYDANGNIRRSVGTFKALDAQGAAGSTASQDYWYRYDSMDRMVTSKGQLASGAITRGTAGVGVDIAYDLAGNRRYTLSTAVSVIVTPAGPLPIIVNRLERYIYDAEGRVTQVNVKETSDGTVPIESDATTKRAEFFYDVMGRLYSQRDYDTAGVIVYYRTIFHNDKSQITSETSGVKRGSIVYKAVSTYAYGSGSTYELGAPTTITTVNSENDVVKSQTLTTNDYDWRDGAVQNMVNFKQWNAVNGVVNTSGTPALNNTSTYSYDIIGGQAMLRKVVIADGRPRTVTFTNDLNGQAIERDEVDNQSGGDPRELWYRFGGRQQGYVGNNGTIDTTYTQSISNRTAAQGTGAFQNGSTSSTSFADFDLAYDAINSYAQGSRGGAYTVQSGDTLQGIAANLWGDADLWYKIAEINGLAGDEALIEGQVLLIPVGVQRNTNSADTFKPYDPLEIMGNLSPTAVKPPANRKKGCGGLGQVLMAIVAVVVAIYAPQFIIPMLKTAGVSGAALTATAAVATGVASSVASQAVGLATGTIDRFSWNAVALSAISAGVGGGIGDKFVNAIGITSKLGVTATSAMVSSAITQGIGVATGLQDKFSWAGVAAAGVGAGFGRYVGGKLSRAGASDFGARAGANSASLIADAATRSLIEGTNFGDNVLAALPNVIGQTIGESIAGGMTGRGASTTGGPKSASQAKIGAKPLSALDVAAACGVPANPSLWDRIGNFFSDVGDTLGFDGRLGFDGTRAAREQAALAPYLWPTESEEIVVTAWLPTTDGQGYVPYVPYNQRPASERTYASAARPTLPPPPSLGQQLYQTFVGNPIAASDFHRQRAMNTFAAAEANGRQDIAPGFGLAFNNLETGLLLANGAMDWTFAPLTGIADAYFGLPLSTATGGRIRPEFVGDSALTIGSMFVAPGAGGVRSVTVRAAGTETGTARYLQQGFTPAQAEYLAAPYEGLGHHFVPRRLGLPEAITESPLNILKPSGISRGEFYELHYRVDPRFYGTRFPSDVGGRWSGASLGLEKYGIAGRLWYGSPTPLKLTVAGATAAGTSAVGYFGRE